MSSPAHSGLLASLDTFNAIHTPCSLLLMLKAFEQPLTSRGDWRSLGIMLNTQTHHNCLSTKWQWVSCACLIKAFERLHRNIEPTSSIDSSETSFPHERESFEGPMKDWDTAICLAEECKEWMAHLYYNLYHFFHLAGENSRDICSPSMNGFINSSLRERESPAANA